MFKCLPVPQGVTVKQFMVLWLSPGLDGLRLRSVAFIHGLSHYETQNGSQFHYDL